MVNNPLGQRQIYKPKGSFRTDFQLDDDDSSSIRWNFSNPPMNCEMTGYFRGEGSSDTVSCKMHGGRHTGDDPLAGCCYIPQIPTQGGPPEYQVECPHPENHDCSFTRLEDCEGIENFRGIKCVIWNTPQNCVHWELWEDQGSNTATSYSNQWVKVSEHTDCSGSCGDIDSPLLRPKKSSSQATFRIDEQDELTGAGINIVEIEPGVLADGSSGTPGTTPRTKIVYPSSNITVSSDAQVTSGAIGPHGMNDGDATTSWNGNTGAYPAWVKVDLGSLKEIDSLSIRWLRLFNADHTVSYNIETSPDSNVWTTRFTDDEFIAESQIVISQPDLPNISARYVRINITNKTSPDFPSSELTPGITELEIYSPGSTTPGGGTTEPTPTPGGGQLPVPEQPTTTLAKEWIDVWHVAQDAGESCDVGGNITPPELVELWNVSGTSPATYMDLFTGSNLYAGLQVFHSDSRLDGTVPKTWTIPVFKTGTPTGDIKLLEYDINPLINGTGSPVLKRQIGSTIAAASLTSGVETNLVIDDSANEEQIRVGYIYVINFAGGDSSNKIRVRQTDVDVLDSSNTVFTFGTTPGAFRSGVRDAPWKIMGYPNTSTV